MRKHSDRVFKERRKLRNKRRLLLPVACTSGFLVVALIIYLLIFGFGPAADNFYPLEVTSEAEVVANSKNIYYLSGATLNCADNKGREKWKVKFTSGAADLSASEDLICVYSSDFATLLTDDGEHMFTIPTTDIRTKSVRCGMGYTAFLGETEDAQYLRVFDTEGAEIYRSEYGISDILDYGFYGANDILYILSLDTAGISPVSRVTTISPATQALTGTIEINDQLISDIKFLDTNMLLCGTSTLSNYDNFGKPTDSTSIYGLSLSDSALSGSSYVYAFLPRDISELTTSCTARIVSSTSKGETDTNIQLPSGVLDAYVSSTKLYCILQDSVYIYKLTGEFERAVEAPSQITGVEKLGDGKLKVCCKDTVYLLLMEQ